MFHSRAIQFFHSSRASGLGDRCPMDRGGHPSPAPPSPTPPLSAGACRPICSTRPHPPNRHWRPGASDLPIGSSSSSPKVHGLLPTVEIPHTGLSLLRTHRWKRHPHRPCALVVHLHHHPDSPW